MTTYTLRIGNPATTRTDIVVVAVGIDGRREVLVAAETVESAFGKDLRPILAAADFKARRGQVLRVPAGNAVRASQVLFVGVGNLDEITPHVLQQAAGTAARSLAAASSVALAFPTQTPETIATVLSGFMAGGYSYAKSGKASAGLADVILLSEIARQQDAIDAFDSARRIELAANQVREWTNTPPNQLTPAAFATAAAAFVTDAGVTADVLEATQLTQLGCGGILGVGQGAAHPPRLLRMRWTRPSATKRIALVGKGITFDSGGLSIKSGSSMKTMKYDMAGAAAVIAATRLIADLGINVDLHSYAPMAENAVSGASTRPGDVITMSNGATVEVTNTDAEGRLILADALGLAVKENPDLIIEISTLTGACIMALGDRIAGVFGDDEPVALIEEAAERARELVWRLPIPEQTLDKVRTESSVADLAQVDWVRWGGASYAAAFLAQFVEDRPFVHLDIAGPAWNDRGASGDIPAGATGFGVRTLVEAIATAVS